VCPGAPTRVYILCSTVSVDVGCSVECIDFVLPFCEIFYNVPAWGPVRKHFIFYILNIYVCTWSVRIVHIPRHQTQRSLRRGPGTVCGALPGHSILPWPLAMDLPPRGHSFHSPPSGGSCVLPVSQGVSLAASCPHSRWTDRELPPDRRLGSCETMHLDGTLALLLHSCHFVRGQGDYYHGFIN